MGFFKNIFGDAADEIKKSLEESKDEMRKSLSEMKRSTMADLGMKTTSSRGNSDDDDDDEPRIILGKFSNGVLDIRDDIEELDDESLEDYKNVKMIIFPRGLKKLESEVICDQNKLEDLDFSFVTELREIPDDFISGTTKIKEFIVPQGVKKLGDGFVGDCKAGTKIVIPSTVEKMGYINGESNNDLLVYLFAPKVKIEDAEEDIKTLYVLPEYYGYYAKQLKDCDSEARLREMPEDMMNVYANSFAAELAKTPAEKPAKKSKEKPAAPKATKPAEATPLDGLVQQIKEQLQSLGLSSFVLYGSDYEGDKEYEEIEQLGDDGLLDASSEYNLYTYDEEDGCTSVYGKLRKINIVDDVVLFDIEEEYEDPNGDIDIRGKYDNQTIGKILRDWDNNAVENGLTNVLKHYLTDKTLIELNGGSEKKAVTAESTLQPTPEPEPKPEPKAEPVSTPEPTPVVAPQPATSDFSGLFSPRMEALINSALRDGVLTDQEKAVLKRRAEKEGEDWDEIEMIINSRLPRQEQASPKKTVELSDVKRAHLFLSFKPYEGDDYAYLFLIDDNQLYATDENLDTPEIPSSDYFEDIDNYECWIENISDEYQSFKQLSESLVNDFVEARLDEFEGDTSALAIDHKYTVTIFVDKEKVYEEIITCR
jgi:hypothetical protein